jgi:P27 family predicted phage terminase small subunit
MKGSKPKPSHLKLVTANPGRRKLNAAEPKVERSRPSAPVHMSDKARETWDYVTGLLDRMGILTEVDATALEMLCEAYADFLSASAVLQAQGSDFYETKNQSGSTMWRAHPALAKKQDADRRIRGWLAEFGMTPSARSRVKADAEAKQEDAAAKYFG